ncbi:MAG TPA: M48 family metallopeptidase [Candidatus Saccharimonadales bacterium]|jgi:heat shock protein HtpX|nr:M48 family metallopeptidase [Candidatus Saccharimonadales bacterium]
MYRQITSNKRRTIIILFVFLLFIGILSFVFGDILGDPSAAYIIMAVGVVYAVISYYLASRTALAVNGAQEIQKKDNPRLWRIVENLSITDGLPMPKVYIIEDRAPNAFATGRDPYHASICVTSGLLAIMNDDEVQGVVAHELGHVKNYDIRVSMITFALVAVVALLADVILRFTFFGIGDRRRNNSGQAGQILMLVGIVAAILAPIVAILIQLAVSRQREYLADATGALTTRYPEGLADALEKIKQTSSGGALQRQNTATAHFFFVNPLRNHSITNLFSTHPPIDERIAKLRGMDTGK